MANPVELEIYDNRIFRGVKDNKHRYFLVHTVTGSIKEPIEVKMIDLSKMQVINKPYSVFADQVKKKLLIWLDEECPGCQVMHSSYESGGRYCLKCKR